MVEDGKKENDESKSTENVPKSDDIAPKERIWESDWMLRTCTMYENEYKDCTSWKGRFQQYFVYGETLDCSQWKVDANNCLKWKKKEDEEAYNELVVSEKKRRLERLRPHVTNDVWTKRNEPPRDWNDPLPEWMNERNKNTFLAGKKLDIEKGKDIYASSSELTCVIL